jgi:ligand-binding sensor domain-containing protein/signal transduction histidine kinase
MVTVVRTILTRGILRAILLAWLVILPVLVQADSPPVTIPQDLTMRTWTKQQGLPDDSVTAVLQTRDGYLWVGTSSGLARFDGMRFTVMSPQDWKTNAPICVTALCEDSSGKLWIGTQDNGLLCCHDGIVSPCPESNGFGTQTINSIADTGDAIWVGTPSGLMRLAGSQLTRFKMRDGLPNDFVSNVHVARSGVLWITTRGGMCQFKDGRLEPVAFQTDTPGRSPESLGVYEDRRGKLWAFGDTYLVNLTDGKHLNQFGSGDAARIWSLCEGRNGELWIGTSGKGLYCFADDKFVPVTLHNGELASDVRAICEDRQGNLWLGTHGDGLVRLQRRSVRVLDTSSGLPNRAPVSLASDPQGHTWIGFDRGGLYQGAAGNFEQLSNSVLPGLRNLVSTLCVGTNSTLWVGTPGAGLYCLAKHKTLHLTTADGLSDNDIQSLALDARGALWVGTAARLHEITNGVIASFGTAEGLPDAPVTAILPARNHGVWLGFSNGAVFREDAGEFRRVPVTADFRGQPIRALCEDSSGRLWIGSENGKLGCVIDNRFFTYDFPSGAPDKSILGIMSTEDGDLWFGTDQSVYSIVKKDIEGWPSSQAPLHPQLVYRADSLPNVATSYGWPRTLKSPDGKLWFAMDSGIVTVDLARPVSDVAAPPVLIEEIAVNGRVLPPALTHASPFAKGPISPVRLPSDVRSLEIHFTALDLSAPEKVRFRYRLEGAGSDWVLDNDLTRYVRYLSLPYGPYTFQVEAGRGDQTWFDNGASFQFLIPTPIWRTQWAVAAYIVAGLIFVAGIARLILTRRYHHRLAALAAQQAMERERMRIARDMHDEIGSKLTKISFMSERAKRDLEGQEALAGKLDSIAGTSRELLQTLDEIVWAVNPHNDTLEHLAAYLGQYATEYLQNTAVECELHIPRGLPHHPLSAEARHNLFLAFEESLNNALKHGQPTHVRVDMRLAPARFEIIVEDNGRGFDPAEAGARANGSAAGRRGNGLQNMRQRLDLLGGQCTIQSRPGHGATVILSVPLTFEPAAAKPNRHTR